ncbi:hypothetical protein JCGZ_19976 [Jatropha curcas]|uniref:Aminotransferase-like plant mobile domain-containing protein n=1 Tax=Jatropha curcas TaxID=180498 RepID=A0A067K693_JATCU|nr:hypothetical protein JCGZ_19976 [Jatropha curcas]
MSQLFEIPAFAYTQEMETLGALLDIPTFDGEPVPVSRNPLTSRTRPLQLLPLSGTEFPVRYETSRMRGFQAEVNLGKARSGGSSTDASAFWDLLDRPMRARVIAAGFGDYAAGLLRTQPRFPLAMRYALMDQWNDCTHTFVFGFSEMTLTPVDYAAITSLRFIGPVAPLDAWYQTATLGAHLVRSLLSVTTQTRYTTQGCVSYEVWAYKYRIYPGGPSGDTPAESRRIPRYLAHYHHTYASAEDPEYWRSFLNDRLLSDLFLTPWDCDAWRTYPGREVAELHTRSRLLMRGYWVDRYYLEGMTLEDLEVEHRGFSANDFLSAGDFTTYFSSRMQAWLPEVLEYTQERKIHKTAGYYKAEVAAEAGAAVAPAGPAGVVLGDVPFPPAMEVVLDPDLGLGSGITIPADLRRAPPPPQLDPEHATHLSLILPVPAHLIPTYGPANFRSRTRGRFDFGNNPTIRWTCPWWRIRLVTIGSMNFNYVLYASLDRSMAYFPNRISRQYGMIQHVPRVHNFESGLITLHLLTDLANRWQNRNTRYLDEGVMQDPVTPAYVNWFFSP